MKVRILIDKVTALHAGTDRHGLFAVEVPASEFTPEERAILARNTYGQKPDRPEADFYLDSPHILGGYHHKRRDFYDNARKVATEPTPAAVHAVLKAIEGADLMARAHIEAEEEEAAREREETVLALLETPAGELVDRSYVNPIYKGRLRSVADDPRLAGLLAEVDAEIARLEVEKARQEAEEAAGRKAEAEAAKREKGEWIVAHGSDYLKKAYGAGYDCQRRYAEERVEREYPAFLLDFDDVAEWKTRACPSEGALDAAVAMEEDCECEVVWLTTPPYPVEDDEEWEQGEALVVHDFLGKYSLIREL